MTDEALHTDPDRTAWLSLSNTEISDASAASLKQMADLQHLRIDKHRESQSFRLAAAIAGIVWYWGDAVGHVRQMVVANNYAPGNAGPWFWTDVIVPLLSWCCFSWFGSKKSGLHRGRSGEGCSHDASNGGWRY